MIYDIRGRLLDDLVAEDSSLYDKYNLDTNNTYIKYGMLFYDATDIIEYISDRLILGDYGDIEELFCYPENGYYSMVEDSYRKKLEGIIFKDLDVAYIDHLECFKLWTDLVLTFMVLVNFLVIKYIEKTFDKKNIKRVFNDSVREYDPKNADNSKYKRYRVMFNELLVFDWFVVETNIEESKRKKRKSYHRAIIEENKIYYASDCRVDMLGYYCLDADNKKQPSKDSVRHILHSLHYLIFVRYKEKLKYATNNTKSARTIN